MMISFIQIRDCQKKRSWKMNLACKSTVSSADVDRLSDAVGSSASAKKIKLDCSSPKVTKERE